jgi:hypothetical protein
VITLNAGGQALQARRLLGEKIPVVWLLYLGLAAPQRYALAGVDLVWGGHTWTARDVVISDVEDDVSDYSALQITLPGVTDPERAQAFADVEGAAVQLYRAWVDPATAQVADAVLRWSGELDVPGWQVGREALVHFVAESRAAIALRPSPIRYTNEEQQRLYPGDTSLDFDPATDAKPVAWPAASWFRV